MRERAGSPYNPILADLDATEAHFRPDFGTSDIPRENRRWKNAKIAFYDELF
jgi:hypothetical protein